ncbi:hypothetical protein EV368DRAFT_89466 [Lentinula lateritia]|nr:hypothetical protein EV368DRAFT_89466 [Lentinula lateritia]
MWLHFQALVVIRVVAHAGTSGSRPTVNFLEWGIEGLAREIQEAFEVLKTLSWKNTGFADEVLCILAVEHQIPSDSFRFCTQHWDLLGSALSP